MTIRLQNQLNRLYKHKPQLVAPVINMVAISTKVVVARIMEVLGTKNVVAEDEEAYIINQMLSVIIAINVAIMQMSAKGDNHAVNCAQEESNHEQDEEDHAVLMAATSNETPNN